MILALTGVLATPEQRMKGRVKGMDSTQVGTTETRQGRKALASRVPQREKAVLPNDMREKKWLIEAIASTKTAGTKVTLPAEATAREIGYFLKFAAREGLQLCKKGSKLAIHCVKEGDKLFGEILERKILLPFGAFDVALILCSAEGTKILTN